MLSRRKLAAVAAPAIAAALPSLKAHAKGLDYDLEPRGSFGVFERLPDLRLESELDFYTSYRTWARNDVWRRAARRATRLFREMDLDPYDTDIPFREVAEMLEHDPVLGMMVHARESTQQIMWNAIRDIYHADGDRHLEEMERAERQGPGTIELHPNMHIPGFARYEIHLQPGGYVGDPFAGITYYHALNVEFPDGNFHDQLQFNKANEVPEPPDGRVQRIFDQGCASGQMTVELKRRFPEAEVWGSDIGAPMLRFAHMRSVDLGVETHYMHELCEESNFPDNHFDIATNFLLYHEIPESSGRAIIHESFRILRPGGIWYPMDIYTSTMPVPSAYEKFFWWFDHRWNHEVWTLEYRNLALDFENEMRRAGFEVVRTPRNGNRRGGNNIMGIKPA